MPGRLALWHSNTGLRGSNEARRASKGLAPRKTPGFPSSAEAHEWGGSAPPRGDQGTGTQGSPVGRRSRLVGGDREFRVADHPQVPDSGLAPRKTPAGKIASEQHAVPPLTSAALRGIAHHAAELGSTIPVLQADLPGLRPNLPGLSALLSGEHVPPPRGHAGGRPRGRDRRRSEMNFSGHNAGVQQDAVAPHSAT